MDNSGGYEDVFNDLEDFDLEWLEDMNAEEEDALNLDHDNLNIELQSRTRRTLRDAVLLELALSSRHKWTYECLIDSFNAKNVLSGSNIFPTTKKQLWKILGRSLEGLSPHFFCDCGNYLGQKKNLPEEMDCPCGKHVVLKKAKHFFVLNLKRQLEHFLLLPGMGDALKYRENRRKQTDEGLEDIFDGDCYKNLMEVMGPDDLTYCFNTDGCKRRGARANVYPLYFRINELPPNLRQKFLFLAAVYVGVGDPDMSAFFLPVVPQLNQLSTEGINLGERTVRIFPTHASLDGKARWQVFNMCPHSSQYGCTMCTIKGVSINGMRYPTREHPAVPPFQDRTHAGMQSDIMMAVNTNQICRGHKGATPLMAIQHFDLAKGQAFDDLHNLYECTAAVLTDLVFSDAPRLNDLGEEAMMRLIDSRMQNIKTPSKISRKPGTCRMKNRSQFTGTEWRNWILYYAVPSVQGLFAQRYINLFELLSHPIYLLSQDIILPDHVVKAERLFRQFLVAFEEVFGVERTRLNMHACLHAAQCVRNWGPLYNQSTFGFESWNRHIMEWIKSAHAAALQIIMRHMISKLLEEAIVDERIPEDIRLQIQTILQKKTYNSYRHVRDEIYVKGGKERRPSQEEVDILRRESFNPNLLRAHKKARIRSVKYCPEDQVKEDIKSNDSIIYTHQDTFCTIQNIVTFEHEDQEVCGLFVTEHTVQNAFNIAQHIVAPVPEQDTPHFILASMVRVPAIRFSVLNKLYLIAMPNTYEID